MGRILLAKRMRRISFAVKLCHERRSASIRPVAARQNILFRFLADYKGMCQF